MRDNVLLPTTIGSPSEFPIAPMPQVARGRGADFMTTLQQAVQSVEDSQIGADEQARRQATGGGNLHETSIALEKADLTMRVLVKARNKAVEAYHEIMRMSV